MIIAKPTYSDAPQFCHYYFNLVEENNLISALQNSHKKTLTLISLIPEEKENYSYAPGKWTTKEVLRHIIDCERAYAYRAFRFSRFDSTDVARFDHNMYISHSKEIQWNLQALKNEYSNIRKSTIDLFAPMTENMLDFHGTVNQLSFTARGLAYLIVGHNIHHLNCIKKNYLR